MAMKFDPTKDYYRILGVPTNATPEEIKKARNEWMKLNHPDQVTRAKEAYVKGGGDDPTTIAMFEEQYQRKTEEAKLVNEAYAVLSDPSDRASYDSMRASGSKNAASEPVEPEPEIVISKTRLDFGRVKFGETPSQSFRVENRGGPVHSCTISADLDFWAEAQLSSDSFPVTITVVVLKTASIGSHAGHIVITVDGVVYRIPVAVEVYEVKAAPAYTPPAYVPPTPPPPAPKPVYTPKPDPIKVPWKAVFWVGVVVAGILFFAVSARNKEIHSNPNVKNMIVAEVQGWNYVPNYSIYGCDGPYTVSAKVTNNDVYPHRLTILAVGYIENTPGWTSEWWGYPCNAESLLDEIVAPNSTILVDIGIGGAGGHYVGDPPAEEIAQNLGSNIHFLQICLRVKDAEGDGILFGVQNPLLSLDSFNDTWGDYHYNCG